MDINDGCTAVVKLGRGAACASEEEEEAEEEEADEGEIVATEEDNAPNKWAFSGVKRWAAFESGRSGEVDAENVAPPRNNAPELNWGCVFGADDWSRDAPAHIP